MVDHPDGAGYFRAAVSGELSMRAILLGLLFTVSLALSSCSTPGGRQVETTWPQEASDLAADPKIVWGRLENGVRYAVLPHAFPRGRVSVNLLVQAGAYQETNDERGYAHFIEHLVFRGTTRFPGNSAEETLQRLGLTSGPDANAYTTLFDTDFVANNLPVDDPTALPAALAILRDFAGAATFDPAAVEAERGVVLSEKRARSTTLFTAGNQMEFVANDGPIWPEIAALYSGQRLAGRDTIGTEETLNAATSAKLRAFYDRWYRPERMIVTIVGDIAPAEAEKLVRQNFSDLAARAPVAEEPPAVSNPRRRPNLSINFSKSEHEPAVEISFCSGRRAEADSTATRREQLAATLAVRMILSRFDQFTDATGAPFFESDWVLSHAVLGQELWTIRVKSSPETWSDAAIRLNAELHRACESGFTDTEFSRTVRRAKAFGETELHDAAVRPSGTLAPALAKAVAYRMVFMPAEAERDQTDRQLASLTAQDCREALRKLFGNENRIIAVYGPINDDNVSRAALGEKLKQSRAKPLEPYVDLVPLSFPYATVGSAGTVVAEAHDDALDADLLRFANGVRLNLKRTSFEPHRVHLSIRFAHGFLACPADQPGLGLGFYAWMYSGIGDLSFAQESAALPEMSGWDLSAEAAHESFNLSATGASGGLTFAVQDLAAHFAHPKLGPKQWAQVPPYLRQSTAPYENTASGVAQNTFVMETTGNPTIGMPSFERVSRYTQQQFEEWFWPQLAAGPIEIAVVGDFDPQAVREAVAQTFGALPPLTKADDAPADARKIKETRPRLDTRTAFIGPAESAAVLLSWTANDLTSHEQRTQGNIVADILADRLTRKLRSEMGDTYSPTASMAFNDYTLPTMTLISATIEAAPDKVRTVAAAATQVATELASGGATVEEFERARQPLRSAAEASLHDNGWWVGVMQTAQTKTTSARATLADAANYRAATLEQINAVARKILTTDHCSQVTALPAAFAAQRLARETAEHADSIDAARTDFATRIAAAPEFADLISRHVTVNAMGLDRDALLAEAYTDRSGERFDRQDYKGAIEDDDKVIALQPKEAVGYNNRGAAKTALNDLTGATADYATALKLSPDFVNALTNRAALEVKQKKYSAALADLNRAIKVDPTNPAHYHARGEVRQAQGDQRAAAADFATEKQLNGENGAAAGR